MEENRENRLRNMAAENREGCRKRKLRVESIPGLRRTGMEIHQQRMVKAQELLAKLDFDFMALFPSSNMLYLSGFYDEPGERMLLLLVPREGEPIFLVPELYEEQIKQESPFQDIRIWRDSDNPMNLLRRTVLDLAVREGKVLVDDGMWAKFFLMLREALPKAKFSLVSRVMVPLRMQKTAHEIHCLEQAGAIADETFEEIIRSKITGMTELTLATALEEAMKERGAEKVAFVLVASGPNSALPHYGGGQRRIEPGDVVILDYGCRIQGYCSDITRTIVCKEASKEIQAVYEIVERAQDKAVQAIRPGVKAEEIDQAARQEITKAGYGERFIHRTGHGIGLDVHEEPYIVEANHLELRQGMAFSVEPGIYLPGQFGIRIEDIVVVTQRGAQRMNRCTHTLQIVE
ncbi:putative dipeptidase PepE [subsurface metagenome]